MKRRFLSLTGILTGMGLSAIMQTYLSVSMPSMVKDLGDMSLYNWVFGAYMLASTVTIPMFGKIADLLGRRKAYLAGLILFAAGLTLCALSVSMPMVVACRALMGVGAGAVTPAALGMVGELFDERDFPKVFGIMGVIQVVSNLIGPLLGGFLNDTLSWRWGLLLFLPLELVCAILISLGPASALPDENGRQKGTAAALKKLDWAGIILLSAGLVCLVLGLQLINWTETVAGICLVGFSPVALVFFAWREKHCSEPLLPLNLLQKPEVRNGMILIFLLGIVNNSSVIYLSLYFQNVLGKDATNAGLLLLPMLISAGIASALCGKAPKRSMNTLSLLLWFASGLSFAGISLTGNMMDGLASMIFSVPVGISLGFLLPRFLGASQTGTDDSNRAVSGGLVQLSRNLGGALGASLLGIWISGTLPVKTGLAGIFLSLTAVSIFAFLYTYIHSRKNIRGQQNGSMV